MASHRNLRQRISYLDYRRAGSKCRIRVQQECGGIFCLFTNQLVGPCCAEFLNIALAPHFQSILAAHLSQAYL